MLWLKDILLITQLISLVILFLSIFFLGLTKKVDKNILCILDTNRRDLAIQKISPLGKLIGKTRTLTINEKLKELLQGDYVLMGNGVNKLKKKKRI